jgi:putative CocE/NonD family hydrolase
MQDLSGGQAANRLRGARSHLELRGGVRVGPEQRQVAGRGLKLSIVVIAMVLGLATGPARSADRGVRLVQASIPMPDGVMLAATLYMPANLRPGERVPALLEYLPYRKDDDTAPDDFGKHAYFARHGYVGARVDIRGFGNSGGAPTAREYSVQEQEDGERVIAWLAHQPWSNGNVGMLGISWGGFNSIQMAMRRPPALKAILAVAATEALFKEDVHYMDGIMHVDEFEVAMDLDQGRSGAPAFALDEDTLAKRMD